MTRLRFLFDEEEKEEEKPGWEQRTRGIGELPKYEFGKMGLEKAKDIEIPESTKLKFTADIGIGAKAVGGAILPEVEEIPSIGVSQRMRGIGEVPKEYSLEGITTDLSKANKTVWSMWWSELKTTEDKWKFLKGENWSPELKQADIETQKLSEEASKLGVNINDWIQYGVYATFFTAMAASILPVLSQLPANILNNLSYKVEGKTVKGPELMKALRRVNYEGVPGIGKPSIFDKKVFAKFIEEGGLKGIGGSLKKGITITETVPRFAFAGKLYAGLPADEIAKSIVEVGKVSAEAVKGLDPVKVSQVTQQLLATSPALASEFLKAVEKPEEILKVKPEVPIKPPIKPVEEKIEEKGRIIPEILKTRIKAPIVPEIAEKEIIPTTIDEAKEILKVDPKKPSVAKDMLVKQMVAKKVSLADIEAVKGEKINVKEPKDIFIALRDIKAVGKEAVVEPTPKSTPAIPTEIEGLAEEIKKVGGNVNADGTVTVYHRTDKEAMEIIQKSGELEGINNIYFSVLPEGKAIAHGEEIIKLNIPLKDLEIDDKVAGDVFLRYPLKNKGSIKIADYQATAKPAPTEQPSAVAPVAEKAITAPAKVEVGVEPKVRIIPKLQQARVKPKIREITGQIPNKIEIAERDILRLVLRGEAKGARKAFSEGKKAGIFTSKEKFAEVVERAKERKAKRDEIGKVKDILKKTKLRELRPERQNVIKKIIDEIGLAKMTEKTKRKLTSRLDYVKDNPDNQIPPEKIADLERLNKKPLSDFTASDIALVKDSILHEINLNKLKNKIIFGKEIKEASEVLKTARENIIKGKDIKDNSASIIDSSITEHETLGQRIKRIWKLDSWNPEVITEELDSKDHGEIMKYLYNGIDKGVTTKLGLEQDIDKWLTDELKDIKIDKWSKAFQAKKKNVDFQNIKLSGYKLPDGKTVGDKIIRITKGERISFLLHAKNEKNLNHLLNGGFRIADNITKKHYLSEDNLNEIINSATKDEVKVVDIMWEFFNEKMKPKLNEASMELNGWEVATEDNYFPIRTVQLDRKRDMLKARKTFSDKTLEGMGIFKERTNASNALILEDAFNIVTKHLEQTSSYIGMAKPLRYAKLMLEDPEIQENIRKVYKKEYIANLKDYLQKIEDNSTNIENFDKLTTEVINKLDTAILGAHIFVSFKQPVSYLIANTEIDIKYLKKGLITKNDYDEIKKNSPQLKQRLDGQINREMGELGNVGRTRQLFLHKSPLNSKLLWMIRATDTVTIGKIWNAVKLEIKDKYPDLSGEEYWSKVTDRAEEVVRRTQPTWHIKDRSSIGRSRSVWLRLLTKYTSQRNKNVNALKRAFLKYNRSEHTAKNKMGLLRKLFTVLVGNALMIEAINELRRKAYGNKSSSIWEYAVNSFITALGNYYVLGDVASSLNSKLRKGTYAGYDTGNIVSSYIDNALDALAEVGRTLDQLKTQERYTSGSRKGELKYKSTAIRALDRSASSVLAFKGLPYDNVRRLLGGIWKMAGEKEEKKPPPLKITIPKEGKLKFTEPKLDIKSTKLKFTF